MLVIDPGTKTSNSFQVIVQIKSAFLYTFEKGMMLMILIFLFKLKRVEIEMDNNATTLNQIIKNLERMNQNANITIISLLLAKVVFISCYTVMNILDIYDYNETRQLISKGILVILNVPCNLIVCYMWVYFF